MGLIIRGELLATPKPLRFSEGRRNADGTMETDVLWGLKTENLMSQLPTRGFTAHPVWTNFKADLFTWSTPLKGVTLLRVSYLAVIPVTLTPGSPLPLDVEEEASNFISEEPITTAPNFLAASGGLAAIAPPVSGAWPTVDFGAGAVPVTVDPSTHRWPLVSSAPLEVANGAVFDTYGQNNKPTAPDYNPNVGRFLYFAPGSPFVGVEAYVLPRGEWSFSYATTTQPNLYDVGKIGLPPGLSAPTAPINYLLVGRRYRRTGFVYRVQEVWRRSGPRGWNAKLYQTI